MKVLLRMMSVCFLLSLLIFPCFAQFEVISTYAGPVLPVTGAQATTQAFDGQMGIVPDGAGGFYFSSSSQNRVYRVSADGKLEIVAGLGPAGYSGDGASPLLGGRATSAKLYGPKGLAVDSEGNLFIADSYNHCIRKVTPSGFIMTVAGNGTYGYSGDGGPATSATLNSPQGVAVDSEGNLFIADTHNNRIRKVSSSGIITTVAGIGSPPGPGYSGDGGQALSAQLSSPMDIALDSEGNLFIADSNNHCIRKVSLSGVITTVAGDGTYGHSGDNGQASSAQLFMPSGVALDSADNLFIADLGNYRIRKVDISGIITTAAGVGGPGGYSGDGGQAVSAQLSLPYKVAIDSEDNIFITDGTYVRKISAAGIITTAAGNSSSGYSGDGEQATSALLAGPDGVAMDSEGNLFISDNYNNCVRKVSSSGIITTVAGDGTFGYSGDGGQATSAQLKDPKGIAVDSEGNLFIADQASHCIRKVDPSGIITTVAGNGSKGYSGDGAPAVSAELAYPYDVAVDSEGNLFIADYYNHCIRKVDPSGIITTVAGDGTPGFNGDGGQAASAQLHGPNGITVDSEGNLFIADNENQRVRKVSPSGIITTVAGNGSIDYSYDGGPAASTPLHSPYRVAVDSEGILFITTFYDGVFKVTPDGIITLVTGELEEGYSGDGYPVTSAQISVAKGITVDSEDNLFIVDAFNNRIRKISKPKASVELALNAGGVLQSGTVGANPGTQSGYATAVVNSGTAPYGIAVFSFKSAGVTVSEIGVPASPPTVAARAFIDYRAELIESGVLHINTGIAVVNQGTAVADVSYTLRNVSGDILTTGHGTIDAGAHISCFINQLKDVAAPDFNLPIDFLTAVQFGTLDITSDQPLSVLALRGTTNPNQQFTMTTTPVADLTQSPGSNPAYFAQLVDGGGYTTSLILMNTSNMEETGTFELLDNDGNPLSVNQVGGSFDSSFNYSIPPDGAFHFQTDGALSGDWQVGWVRLTPDPGTSTPGGSGLFTFSQPWHAFIAESGIPSASATTHARIYVDLSNNHNTGLAIANISDTNADITIEAYETDGVTAAGAAIGPLTLPAYGHDAQFVDQLISGLPAEFTGVLDISSSTPFAALTVRSLFNESGNFLMTTFPVADVNQPAPSSIVFPQIADGGGHDTQFVLISTGEESSTTLDYFGNDGSPLAVGK